MTDADIMGQLTLIPHVLVPFDLLPTPMRNQIERAEVAGRNYTVFEVQGFVRSQVQLIPLIVVTHGEDVAPMAAIRKAYMKSRRNPRSDGT